MGTVHCTEQSDQYRKSIPDRSRWKDPALGEYFLNEVREDLKKTGFRRMADNVTVRYSQLQSDSFLNGAMKYFFDIHYSFTDQDPTNFFIG